MGVSVFVWTERGHRKRSSQSLLSQLQTKVSAPVIAVSFVTEGFKIRAVSLILVGERKQNFILHFLKGSPKCTISLSLSGCK